MHSPIQAYLTILKLELVDLEKDLDLLVNRSTERHNNEEITDYVFMENVATLKNEISGVDGYVKYLDTLREDSFDDIDSLIDSLKSSIAQKVKQQALAGVVEVLLNRKIDKVKMYLEKKD